MTIQASHKITRIIVFVALFFCVFTLPCLTNVYAQTKPDSSQKKQSVHVDRGMILILKDTIIIPEQDTNILIPKSEVYRLELNPEAKSEAFYDSLKVKAYRTRLTKELYDLMIKGKKEVKPQNENTVKATSVYEAFEGRHIGKIKLKKVDVLDGDVEDTTKIAATTFAKLANYTHVYTRDRIIYNTLIFESGDKISPDELADNERIIRSLGFIHDARIILVAREHEKDTMDVLIVTQDKFDYQFEINVIGPTNFDLKFKDNSVMGLGKELGFNYLYNTSHLPASGFTMFYHDRNFKRTFVDIDLRYSHYWAKEGTDLSIRKDFLTPQTKWGGGLSAGMTTQKQGINDYPDTSYSIPYTHNYQDVWVGRSFSLGLRSQRKNLTLTARLYREEYTTRPYVSPDSNSYFFNDILMITGISYTKVSYLKSSMIRAFGVTEDMPVGHYLELNTGYVAGEFKNTPYLGLKSGWGHYFHNFGYVDVELKLGGFVQDQDFKQGAYDLRLGYFTPLVNAGRWRFRQFVNLRLTGGLNRYKYTIINMNDQIYGISQAEGDQRLSLKLESVFFKPMSVYGFQLALFGFIDMGLIGTGTSPQALNNFYSSLGAGIRLRNEGLIIQNMEIKLGYVPKLPNDRGKFNYGFATNDPVLFRQLSISRPDVVPYN